jgi:pantothenate kinase
LQEYNLDFWEQLSQESHYLDGTEKRLEVDRRQVEQFYLPLADYIIARLDNHSRLIIGVAGPPGCGKSAFSALLAAVLNAHTVQDTTCVVGMDGWHFPNAYLDHHTTLRAGQRVSLRSIKGAPETFDVQALLSFLASIREGRKASYPVYSRRLHDPIPNGGEILLQHKYVIVEGNYLYLHEPPWKAFQSFFDIRIYIDASLQAIQPVLLERHLRGGKDLKAAQRQIQAVDIPDAERVLSGSIPATIVIHKLNSRLIQSLEGLDR